jgi:hypothetical protein
MEDELAQSTRLLEMSQRHIALCRPGGLGVAAVKDADGAGVAIPHRTYEGPRVENTRGPLSYDVDRLLT